MKKITFKKKRNNWMTMLIRIIPVLLGLEMFLVIIPSGSLIITNVYAADMARMEWGVETGVDTSWTTVNLANTFSSPIVVASSLYNYTSNSETGECSVEAEVQSVTTTSFQVRMGLPPHDAGSSCTSDPTSIDIHWMVAEDTGTSTDITLPGTAILVQAGSFSDTDVDHNGSWTTDGNVTYYPTWGNNPNVLARRVTWNDSDNWATAWATQTGSTSNPPTTAESNVHIHFNQAEVDNLDFSPAETLHYVLYESGETGTISGDYGSYVEAVRSGDAILGLNDSVAGYSIGGFTGFSGAPEVAVAFQLEMDGANGGWWHAKSISSSDMLGWSLEDQDQDAERVHINETSGTLAFETTGSYPEATFTQNRYRWYVDNDSTNPVNVWGDPDLAENTAITIVPAGNDPPNSTQELRLRVNLTVNTGGMPVGMQQFQLQYKEGTDGSCITGSWTDVGSSATWEYATSSVTDGEDITGVLTGTDRDQEYVKSNPTAVNHSLGRVNEDVEYDFHIIGTNISDATQYSFRVIEADDTVLDAYTNCPTLTTEPGTASLMRHGNLFVNESEQGFFWAE